MVISVIVIVVITIIVVAHPVHKARFGKVKCGVPRETMFVLLGPGS